VSTPGIRFVAGESIADTVGTVLPQALTVEVRDQSGAIATGAVVRFESVPISAPNGYPFYNYYGVEAFVSRLDQQGRGTFAADTTDGTGRARVIVALGSKAGPARVIVSVPAYAFTDTAEFTVRPGNAAHITLKVRDTLAIVGNSYTIGASVADLYGNPRANDAVAYTSTSDVVSVDGAGTVKALSSGRGRILVRAGSYTDTAKVSVVPDGMLAVVTTDGFTRYIATVKLDGSQLTQLTPISSTVLLPRWNPAGTRIAFYERDPGSNAGMYEVDLQKNRTPLVAVADPYTQFFPRYSKDGQWVYFSGATTSYGYASWRAHLDGTGVELLTNAPSSYQWEPSPSPDGTRIVLVVSGTLSTLLLSTHAITSLGVSGSVPEFSPDGTQIAFRTASGQLGIMPADGGSMTAIAGSTYYDDYSAPSWSSDGKWIVIGGSYSVPDLVSVSTHDVLPLTGMRNTTQPSFRP
jgi:Tol biopolymer transport system component